MNLALRSTGIIQIGNNIFFEKKTAHQAEAAPSAVIQAVSKQSALNGLLVVIR